jgi:RNA polymerase sigma factor (sigma-70 family)
MSNLNTLIVEYQELLRKEKLLLLELPFARKRLVQSLESYMEPTRQRRINADKLEKLIKDIKGNKISAKKLLAQSEELKLHFEMWGLVRDAAEATSNKQSKEWRFYYEKSLNLRNDILVETYDLVKKVRALSMNFEGAPKDDLEGIGIFGLIKSMENYDPAFGKSFENYARVWILNSMINFLRKDKLIRPSEKMSRLFRKHDKAIEELRMQFGREPEEFEIAAAIQLDEDELSSMRDLRTTVTSLDAPLETEGDDDSGTTLHDLIGEKEAAPYEKIERRIIIDHMFSALKNLNSIESSIVGLRWDSLEDTGLEGKSLLVEDAMKRLQEISFEHIKKVMKEESPK